MKKIYNKTWDKLFLKIGYEPDREIDNQVACDINNEIFDKVDDEVNNEVVFQVCDEVRNALYTQIRDKRKKMKQIKKVSYYGTLDKVEKIIQFEIHSQVHQRVRVDVSEVWNGVHFDVVLEVFDKIKNGL